MTETELFLIIVVGLWLYWGLRLVENFTEELESLPLWKDFMVQAILMFGAGFFFIEEMLEILIDVLIGDEDRS
jgi:TRAP-type C4-dicarboxylate transport system permease small subunit